MVTAIPSTERAYRSPSTVEQTRAGYQPDYGDVMSTYGEEVWQGVGSSYYDAIALQIKTAQGQPIAEADWKGSEYYREGVDWIEGLNTGSAKIIAEQTDRQNARNFVLAKASGPQTAAGLFYALAVGVPEPKNVVAGFATSWMFGGIIGEGANSLRRLTGIMKNVSKFKQALALGTAEGVVSAAIVEPLNQYSASVVQQDYTAADSLFNVVTSGVFGAGLRGVPAYFGDKKAAAVAMVDNTTAKLHEDAPLDQPGAEAMHTVEEKVRTQNERDIFVRQKQEMEGRLSEAELNNSRIHDEITQLESAKDREIYGIDDPAVISAIKVIESETITKKDTSLFSFIKKAGGIKEEDGELKAMGITSKTNPGLLNNKKGMTHDELGEKLWEAGYFTERPSVNQVRDLLAQAASGRDKIKGNEKAVGEAQKFLDEVGIDPHEVIKNKQEPVEAQKAIDGFKQQITGPDKLDRIKQHVKDYEQKLAAFPKDEQLVPQAAKYIKDTLAPERSVYDNDLYEPLSAEDIKSKSDEDQHMLDRVEQLKSEVDEVPIEVRNNEQEYTMFEKIANAAYFCLTRE